MSDFDFLENAAEETKQEFSVSVEITNMLQTLTEKREAIAEAEARLKALKEEEKDLVQTVIPQAFKKHNIGSIKLGSGVEVVATEEMTCSLIKDEERRKQALAWLIDNGGEDLIHDVATIESPTLPLLELFNKQGVLYSLTRDVNTNSLKAWFREKLGMKPGVIASLTKEEVPKEFGLFIYDIAKIKEPKGRG